MVKMVVSEVQTQTEQIKAFCQAYNQALNNVSKATQGMGLAQGLSGQGMEAIKGYISSAYPALCKAAIMHSEATVQANEQYIQDYLSTCGSEDLDSDELQAQIDEADALIQEFQRSKDSYAQQKRSLSGEKEKIMGAVFQMAIGIMEAGITRNQAKKAKLQEKLQKFLDFCGRSDSHFAGLKDTGSLLAKGMQALGGNEKGQVGVGSWNGKGFSLTDRSWIKTANQKWQSRLEIKDKQLLDGCTIIHIIDTDRGVDMYMFEKNGRRYPVNERDLSADLRTLIKKYGLNVVKLSPTEMDRRVTEFQKSGKDYFSGATVNLPGFKKLARGQGIVNDLKDSGFWDAAWAVGLTVAAVRNAQTDSKKASGTNKKVISELESPVLNGQRVESGTKVDNVKPVWGKDSKGKPVIEKEFPQVAKEHGFPDIIDNYPTTANEYPLVGGDGVDRKFFQLEGSNNGKKGVFEWIVEPNGDISHRRFIDGGVLTGKPNQIPKK
jgi:hypothetical protein